MVMKNLNYQKHLIGLAKYSGLFENVFPLDQRILIKNLLKNTNILNFEKVGDTGYGNIICGKLLNEIDKNDIVIYCDAGASFNYKAKKRFLEYIEILNNSEFGNLRIECEKYTLKKLDV